MSPDQRDWKKAVAADNTLLGLAEWVQERAKTAHGIFEEPECCEQCESDNPMEMHNVSVIKGGKGFDKSKKDVPGWICQDCGFAHLNPDHDSEDCAGC